jgi:hypothetical protein
MLAATGESIPDEQPTGAMWITSAVCNGLAHKTTNIYIAEHDNCNHQER